MRQLQRNRSVTERKILNALEQLLIERGVQGIGINKIAEKAGISKVLIYRYFGGLAGLLTHYVKVSQLLMLPDETELQQTATDQPKAALENWLLHMTRLAHSRQHNPATAELLRAFATDPNALVDTFSHLYDVELNQSVEQHIVRKAADTNALLAVFVGVFSYLTLLSDSNRTLFGISPKDPNGAQRLDNALALFYKVLFMADREDVGETALPPVKVLV